MTCHFSVLGDVQLWRDGQELYPGSPQQSAVLARLLLAEGRPVTTDQLVTDLWGADTPKSAVVTVRTYISRLRTLLRSSSGHAINSTRAGYTLPVDKYTFDLLMFIERAETGRQSIRAGEPCKALSHLDDALSLWRGSPLAGIHADFVSTTRSRLERLRLNAVIDRQELKLGLGEHVESLDELSAYSAENPMEERLHGLRMLALYRSTRQADALTVYRNVRAMFIDKLGIEPGPELRDLQQRILRADPDLLLAKGRTQATQPTRRTPSPLPSARGSQPHDEVTPRHGENLVKTRLQLARQRGFVGRSEERRSFRTILSIPDGRFSVLFFHGPYGIGKSTLMHLLAGDAGKAGRHVIRVDGQQVRSCIDSFAAAAAPAVGDDNAVLFIDSFECCTGLEQWLRETFLPDLSSGAVVVMAGRRRPSMAWRADAAWSDALATQPLGELSRSEAIALLEARNVPAAVRDRVARCVGGHPLALCVAADVARDEETDWLRLHASIHEALADTNGGSGGDESIALMCCLRDGHPDSAVTLRSIV